MFAIFVFSILLTGGCCDKSDYCTKAYKCSLADRYRSDDGSCNNVKRPWIGSVKTPYKRFLPPIYDDGTGSMRTRSVTGTALPNSRSVTLSMHYPVEKDGPLNLLAVIFGQMVTHDIIDSAKVRKADGTNVNCFGADKENPNCIQIPVPPEDTVNAGQKVFVSSRTDGVFMNSNCEKSSREQINTVTHWLDLSVIYGNDKKITDTLRVKSNGVLKTSDLGSGFRDALPQALPGSCFVESQKRPCFISGEDRVNENMILTATQTLWVREHNRIARILQRLNPQWNDEVLFQEAKRIVTAEYQHIIYNEWLPLIIGRKLMRRHRLSSHRGFNEQGYDVSVDGQILNEFATAAFRFGHGMVKSEVTKCDENFKTIRSCPLKSITLDSTEAYTDQGLDAICRGALGDRSSLNDAHVTDTLTHHLFEIAIGQNLFIRSSLPALNIQRGRDHGLNTYNAYRQTCGLKAARQFRDLIPDISSQVVERLSKTYTSVDDIDLFTGGMSEEPLDGAMVGPTFACIIAKQFENLKYGDRFFYTHETINEPRSFSPRRQRISSRSLFNLVRPVTFAGILASNLDATQIQQHAFLPYEPTSNSFKRQSEAQLNSVQSFNLMIHSC